MCRLWKKERSGIVDMNIHGPIIRYDLLRIPMEKV